MPIKIPVRIARQATGYEVLVGPSLLSNAGFISIAGGRAFVISNRKVFGLYGETLQKSLRVAGVPTTVHLIGDGERFKNIKTLETALVSMGEQRVMRSDSVIALGGGVVGDVAGLAASLYLRGLRFFYFPTTLLAMIDASVGGKTGINTEFGKNLIGTFYQPSRVVIDVETLRSLPRREITAGLCEAIKQAAVGGKPLLDQTAAFLEKNPPAKWRTAWDASLLKELTSLIAAHVKFKAGIVQNDETEAIESTSPRSRKILNFGHTFAHALEKATKYRYLKHGEAVGHGIRFAVMLSKRLELLSQVEVESLHDALRRAGDLPAINHIDPSIIQEAFVHDKKRVGSNLHWVLLRGVGKPVIIPGTDIPGSTIKATIKQILRK